jgi:hypothetical protein
MKERIVIQKKPIARARKTRQPKNAPKFETMFEDEGDPLEDVDYGSDDLEISADNEMTAIVQQIKEQKKAQQDRFRIARDPDYWCALCFQSHEQRDQFLDIIGWRDLGEKYLNGLEVARRLGVEVKWFPMSPLPQRGKPKKYTRKEVI